MRTINNIIGKGTVVLLGICLGTASLLAQQAAPATDTTTQSGASAVQASPAQRPQLSLEQKKQMHEILTGARDQAAIIRHDQTLTAEQQQAKLKDLRAGTREKIKAILTPEQQQAMASRRAERQQRVAQKLGLTAEQQGKMKDLFVSTHQQREAVLTNTGLSNEQKQSQLAQLRANAKTQLATILTPDQLQKFQQMRRHHHHVG